MNERQRSLRAALTGVAGGVVGGLTGVGGGAIMVPLLTGILKMPQHRAHGTSLAVIIFIAIAGAIPYIINGDVEWRLVLGLGAGSVSAAMLGARAMTMVPEVWLRRLFAVFLLVTAARMMFA